MKVAPIADFKGRLPSFLRMAKKEPIFVTRNGKIAAVVEAITDAEVEDYLLERSPRFRAMLRRAAVKKGGMSLEAYRRSRGL